jgi:two-component system CheB/CheR fusion protein
MLAAEGRPFAIVGIGASAGGHEALDGLVRKLVRGDMAYVVVQHLVPGHEAMLVSILSRLTSLEVVVARDGQAVEPGLVYVAPPATGITIVGRTFRVGAIPRPTGRLPIDSFFRSLAADQGRFAVGVVLSGEGSDGTLGLRAIKEAGGITFAQDLTTALHRSMPRSAQESGFADLCMTPGEIGLELGRLAAHPGRAPTGLSLVGQGGTTKIFGLLRAAFGVDFGGYKPTTIERRLERRMVVRKVAELDNYVALLESDADELAQLYRDLLVGVTNFFRDKAPFEALATVFPSLLAGRPADAPIRIWVVGCATGEEPYSIAMCLLEHLGDRAAERTIQVFATDVDPFALARARDGIYPQEIELDVSPERLARFFEPSELGGYRVTRRLRELVLFAQHDLTSAPPFMRIDLLSSRNVLMYLQPDLQRRALRCFHYALRPGGNLLLGESETTGDSELFSPIDPRLKLYRKKDVPRRLPLETSPVRPDDLGGAPAAPARPDLDVHRVAEKLVAERFGPPGIVVNEKLEVVSFLGKTSPFIDPVAGTASLNLSKLARPELQVDVRAAIQKALADGLPVTTGPVVFKDEARRRKVVLEAIPLRPGHGPRCVLVLFEEKPETLPVAPSGPPPPSDTPSMELERELTSTRDYLQTTVEELESTNEQLLSANEHYQTANEELATAKEELQASNEELRTANEELGHRMDLLAASNDDLQNVLAEGPTATIIVGRDLAIRRYSRAAERLFGLLPADVGRPVKCLRTMVPASLAAIASAIETAMPREQAIRCVDGSSLLLHAAPYRASDQRVLGAVLTFSRLGDQPNDGKDWAGAMLAASADPLVALDDRLRVFWVNGAFEHTFGVDDAPGRTLDELYLGPERPAETWSKLEDAAAGGLPFRDHRVERPLGRSDLGPMVWDATCIPACGERPPLTLIAMRPAARSAGSRPRTAP